MSHILLFGGAFDPPHLGHLDIARLCLAQRVCDQIWLVPCFQHPFGKTMAPAADRLQMLELGLEYIRQTTPAAGDKVRIEDYEITTTTPSYSIETLEHFAGRQPDDTFAWLIGSDQLKTFDQWHRWQELLQRFTVYVYPRAGYPLAPLHAGMVALDQLPTVNVSSTSVRTRISKNLPISDQTTTSIETYIRQHGLYQAPS